MLNLDYKKIIWGGVLLIVAVIIGWLIYLVFFRTASTPTPTANLNVNQAVTGALPIANVGGRPTANVNVSPALPTEKPAEVSETAKGGVTYAAPLTSENSQFVIWSADKKNLVYYNRDASQFYRVSGTGEITPLTDKKFYNVENVVWAPTQDKAILEYPDDSKIVYNFKTDKQFSLPKHWEDFDFSPNGSQIVAKSLGLDSENRWLIVTNDDGSQARKVESLGENEDIVTVGWSPNNQVIATYVKGVDFDRQDLFFVGLNNENFKTTTIEGRGFQGLWTPQGDRMLYSVYSSDNGLRPELWVVDAQGDNIGNNRKRLQIQTWANKCAFADNATLYCGVPESLDEGSGLFGQLNTTNDYLYRINLKTGSKELIAKPLGSYSISKLLISSDQGYLYFNDAKTGQIFKVRLK